jgi:hypothetical protein
MTMFELPAERTPDRVDLIRTWVPRIAMGMFFLGSPGSAIIPAAVILGMLIAIGASARPFRT